MTDNNFINISQRAYKFIRGYTINNVYEGLVELITNSDDAYNKGKILDKKIDITCDYENKITKVTDQAIGLNGEDMIKCFLQVGEYTSSSEARGFFSRGAKDISILGNLTFESIKNNKYSKVTLDSFAKGNILSKDENVTKEIRERLKINNNGLQVTIEHNSNIDIDSPDFLVNRFPRYYSLRRIFSDKNTVINLEIKNHSENFDKIHNLKYIFPKGDLVLYLNYTLPSYPDANINFVLNKSSNNLHEDEYNNIKFCDYGILICNNLSIHENSILDHQHSHYEEHKKYFGVINTTYLHKLMYDYDNIGPTKLNPSPIIDPSRMNGINTKHPFFNELVKIPKDRIRFLLEENESNLVEKTFYIQDINSLIDELNLVGSQFVESNELTSISRSRESQLIRGIESDRGKFVNVENNFTHDLYKMKFDESINNSREYIDPMTAIFDIIGRGDEGTIITDELAKEKLYKISNNETSEKKKIFVYDKVDIKKNDPKMESLNSSNIKKNNIFEIKFIEFKDNNKKYEINYSNEVIILKINVNFPTITNMFKSKKFNEDKNTNTEAVLTLGSIISEALTRVQLSCYIQKNYITINNDDSSENYNTLFKNYDVYKNSIDKRIHNTISKILDKLLNENDSTEKNLEDSSESSSKTINSDDI